jgi:outer membrane protein OmpA-like peptidoglycan-associated protein
VARFEDVPALKARASLVDGDQARELLRPRFKAQREPAELSDATTAIRPLTTPFNPVPLSANVPAKVSLRPSIESIEVPGTTFEFGRSFVRAAGIEPLAKIAEALRNTTDLMAMLFGHTDISGGEALNKELSERRARAVHALLTHDSSAWEQLFSGTADGANWTEKWDVEEVQHMLNALRCGDANNAPLVENDKRDEPTKQAIRRFQRGDFPDRPAEQTPLPESDTLGVDGRRALFLAYAKRISRQPIAPDRFASIGGARSMGCGEFNPLSISARDEASRRVHVFVLDPVAVPDDLPCALRKLPPCKANSTAELSAPNADGSPPFRCRVFQKLTADFKSAPSPDLNHDLILRFPLDLANAGERLHKYKLEADDGTITIERSLADDSRSRDDGLVELTFEHLPELHRYRLTCDDGEQAAYTVFDFATLKELQERFRADTVALDLNLPGSFLTHVTSPADPVADDDPNTEDGEETDTDGEQDTA